MRVLILFALITFALAATTKRTKQTAKAAYEWEGPEDTSFTGQSRMHPIQKKVAEYWNDAAEGLETLDKWQKSLRHGFKLLRAVYEGPQNRVPPEDYLKVCQSPSGPIAKQVKRTLQKTKSDFRRLIQAIKNDDIKQLESVILKFTNFNAEKAAGFYAGIKALSSLEQSHRSSGQQESCLSAIRNEFENMHKELHKLMPALKETIDELRQISCGQNFINIFQNLMQVRIYFDKYLETPSQTQRENFFQVCYSQNISLQTKEVVDALDNCHRRFHNLTPMEKASKKDLINVLEATAGLLAQSFAMKASCNEAAQVGQSNAAQVQQFKADIQEDRLPLLFFTKDFLELRYMIFGKFAYIDIFPNW